MAFQPSKGKRYGEARKKKTELNLGSMMDMMTIILLFLIKSYSATGGLIQPSKHLDLPQSQRDMRPKKVVAILVTKQHGVLEDIEEEIRQLSPAEELLDDANVILPGLADYLDGKREFFEKTGQPFKGEITIQCDKEIPYNWLLKVINTCGQTEFSVIDFVVKKIET